MLEISNDKSFTTLNQPYTRLSTLHKGQVMNKPDIVIAKHMRMNLNGCANKFIKGNTKERF